MYKGFFFFFFVFVSYAYFSCVAFPNNGVFIGCNAPEIKYMGRIERGDSASIIYWSGSSIEINFEGTEVAVSLKDETGKNYFYILIDRNKPVKLKPDTLLRSYTLASGLNYGKHNLKIYKLTEESHGKTWFYGLILNKKDKLLPKSVTNKRKIEFYGNSISAGYSLEDTVGDSKKPEYFNNYLTYAAITARHYNAEYSCIAKSGIGIMVSWFPIIMPEMYDRLDSKNPESKWDFSQYTPNIVVVELMTNDLWLFAKPQNENFIARFGDKKPDEAFIINSYKNFVTTIRNKYPNASIICVLDDMSDPECEGYQWPGYIDSAVHSLNDAKIYTHFFPHQFKKGHPKAKDHERMASNLIKFIDENIKW